MTYRQFKSWSKLQKIKAIREKKNQSLDEYQTHITNSIHISSMISQVSCRCCGNSKTTLYEKIKKTHENITGKILLCKLCVNQKEINSNFKLLE